MKICVIGLGYIGLPTALMFAKNDYQVTGVDISETKISSLKNGVCFSEEDEVKKLYNIENVRRNFSVNKEPVESDIFIIAVPTPLIDEKKEADLSFLESAVNSVVPVIKKNNLMIIESTIPPGTCRDIIRPIIEKSGLVVSKDVFLAHCPEQILVGNSIHDLIHNPKIVGGIDPISTQKAKIIYQSFVQSPIYTTTDVVAETAKVAANAFRDVNIAFANELAEVCEKLDVSIEEAVTLANTNPRVSIHKPGIGVGGHCIPIDPFFIAQSFPDFSKLILTARKINDGKPRIICDKILKEIRNKNNPDILVCGISYKPNIKDTRESPALKIVDLLKENGCNVTTFDPVVNPEQEGKLTDFVKDKDAMVILVPHDNLMRDYEFNKEEIRQTLKTDLILEF